MGELAPPQMRAGEMSDPDKTNDELHEKTKEALGNLIVRKDELESNGIETEMMYKELMNCVSPWRRKKLQQEASQSQSALEDALRNADDLMKQAKVAFEVRRPLQTYLGPTQLYLYQNSSPCQSL